MAFWDQEESLVTIDKNKAEKIEFKYCEKGDKKYFSETFIKNIGGENKPIGGTSFPVEQWPAIKETLDKKYNEMMSDVKDKI